MTVALLMVALTSAAAVGLAVELGIADEPTIKAIEAAARTIHGHGAVRAR